MAESVIPAELAKRVAIYKELRDQGLNTAEIRFLMVETGTPQG